MSYSVQSSLIPAQSVEYSVISPRFHSSQYPLLVTAFSGAETNLQIFFEETLLWWFSAPAGPLRLSVKNTSGVQITNLGPFRFTEQKLPDCRFDTDIPALVLGKAADWVGLSAQISLGQTLVTQFSPQAVTNPLVLTSGQTYQLLLQGKGFRAVYSVHKPRVNLALQKPVYGTFTRLPESSFVYDQKPAINRVNDGQLDWYTGTAASATVDEGDQYMFINLEKSCSLRQVNVFWNSKYAPLAYQLVFSQDGKNWQKQNRSSSQYKTVSAPDFSQLLVDEYTASQKTAYLGVIVPKGQGLIGDRTLKNFVELVEVEAYD